MSVGSILTAGAAMERGDASLLCSSTGGLSDGTRWLLTLAQGGGEVDYDLQGQAVSFPSPIVRDYL